MTTSATDTRCWDQYWLSGRQSCCDEHRETADAAIVARRFAGFFAGLARGQRVLDLCTGNGAVPKLAIDSGSLPDPSVELYGIDSAAILPALSNAAGRTPGIAFIRGSALKLPFRDSVFDALTSQFGIEYLPREPFLAEALRVLRPGGKALFVTHAAAGITATTARAELVDIAELLEEIDPFGATRRALDSVCRVERAANTASAADIDDAMRAREKFQATLRLLADTWQRRTASAVFRDSGSILQHTYRHRAAFDLDVLEDKVDETERSVSLHRERLEQLVNAALDRDGCDRLVGRSRELGASDAGYEALMTADGLSQLGWAIWLVC